MIPKFSAKSRAFSSRNQTSIKDETINAIGGESLSPNDISSDHLVSRPHSRFIEDHEKKGFEIMP